MTLIRKLKIAEHLAMAAHEGQTDKAGAPYIGHLKRVSETAREMAESFGMTGLEVEDIAVAAMLHDVIEDTSVTSSDVIAMGFSERTADLIRGVTRPSGDDAPTYQGWISEIASSGDAGLIIVKLADNRDNSDPDRIAALGERGPSLEKKYRKAREVLEDGLERALGREPFPAP